MTGQEKLNVLIIYSAISCRASTIQDHISSFHRYSYNNVYAIDHSIPNNLEIDITDFDVLVFHYSIVISMKTYVSDALAQQIRVFRGYKVLFIQDEYRWVDQTAEAISDLGVDVIYTVIDPEVADEIYHHPSIRHVRRKTTRRGYVPERLVRTRVPRFEKRMIDVGYRARRLPMWNGYFGQEKWLIGERFQWDAKAYELVCDIEHDECRRLYGRHWVNFVSGCKATLGTEGGVSMIDFTGNVQRAVERYVHANPDATFCEVRDRFLEGRDGEIEIRGITPRCFEAAALRTLMILYPGSYSGVLEPWRHYVPLERSHGNMAEVVAVLRDPERAQSIIDRTYREIALDPKYGYRSMVEEFDRDLLENARNLQYRHTAREMAGLARRRALHGFWTILSLYRCIDIFWAVDRTVRNLGQKMIILMIGLQYRFKSAPYRYAVWTIDIFCPKQHQPRVRKMIKQILIRTSIIRQ